MQFRFRNNPKVSNILHDKNNKKNAVMILTTLGFLAGAIDIVLNSQSMGHPRYGLELVATLGLGGVAAYKFAEKTLNEIFDEGDQTSANSNL
ncbi:MAG: hypothetical protein WC004_00760 [Candidatus Absconditabacterales bacterium]